MPHYAVLRLPRHCVLLHSGAKLYVRVQFCANAPLIVLLLVLPVKPPYPPDKTNFKSLTTSELKTGRCARGQAYRRASSIFRTPHGHEKEDARRRSLPSRCDSFFPRLPFARVPFAHAAIRHWCRIRRRLSGRWNLPHGDTHSSTQFNSDLQDQDYASSRK